MKRLLKVLRWSAAGLGVLLVLLVAVLWLLAGTEWGSRRAVQLADGWLEPGVRLDIGGQSGTLLEGLRLEEVEVEAGDISIALGRLHFAWRPWQLLQNNLQIDSLLLDRVRLDMPAAEEENAEFAIESVSSWFDVLPFQVRVDNAQLHDFLLRQGDTTFSMEEVALGASLDQEALRVRDLSAALFDIDVSGAAALTRELQVEGMLAWSAELDRPYAGELEVDGDLLNLILRHDLREPFAVKSAGTVATGLSAAAPLNLDLRHQAPRVDLGLYGANEVVLSDVDLSTRGAPASLAIGGTLDVDARQLATAGISFDAVYSGSDIDLDSLSLRSPQIALDLSGAYAIQDQSLDLNWSLQELTLQQYMPGVTLSDISGDGEVALSHADSTVTAMVELGPLRGRLNNQALSIAGTLMIADSRLESVDLEASSGDNMLAIAGTVTPDLALQWQLAADSLQQLWAGLSGSASGSGQVSGTPANPLLRGDLAAEAVSLTLGENVIALDELSLRASADGADNDLSLMLAGLTLDAGSGEGERLRLIDTASLHLLGNPGEHTLNAELAGMDSTVDLALRGALEEDGWNGRLLNVDLLSPYGDWLLQGNVDLAVSPDAFDVARHCWMMQELTLCAAASGNPDRGIDAEAELEGFPLRWLSSSAVETDKPAALQQWQTAFGLDLPEALSMEGVVDMNVQLDGFSDGSWDALEGELMPRDVAVQLTRLVESDNQTLIPELLRVYFEDISLAFANRDGLWTADAGLRITEEILSRIGSDAAVIGETVDLQGNLQASVTVDSDDALQGSATVDFASIAWLEAMIPALRNAEGSLDGMLTLSGTTQAPVVHSMIDVTGGRFRVPDYGLDVQDLAVRIDSSEGELNADLSAASGQGRLALRATVLRPFDAGRELTAVVEGENFTLMDTDAATVIAGPDLQLHWSPELLSIQGRVNVPTASIALEEWVADTGGAVSTSGDVVVVQGDEQALTAAETQPIPLSVDVTLDLGDAVSLSGFGLQTSLRGSLTVQQEVNRSLLAYGELNVYDGMYTFYNQELNIDDGRLQFYGNPLNPVIDVRAHRETSKAEVGIRLGGSLNNIQGTLYSTPTLPESEILALLVTGKSFDNVESEDGNALLNAVANFGIERGEGLTSTIGDKLGLDTLAINPGDSYEESALGVGKYLTPNLLMSYEVGLFDRQAVLSIEYTLTEHLELEVRSGISQSVDLSYTIEYD